MASRVPPHQHLGDVGTMRLILLWCPHGLRRAQDFAALVLGHDHGTLTAREALRHCRPETLRLGARHRLHEIHRCAPFHAVDQHLAQTRKLAGTNGWEAADHGHAHADNTTIWRAIWRVRLRKTTRCTSRRTIARPFLRPPA